MSLDPNDITAIETFMATEIDEGDLPPTPPAPREFQRLTNASINRICKELRKRNGMKLPDEFRRSEKMERGRNYSIEQMSAVIAAYWARVEELIAGE